MFLTTEHSAPLLLQLQNVKKHSATVVAETFGNRGSRTPEFFSGVRIFFFYGCRRAELLSSEKHSALVVAEEQKFSLVHVKNSATVVAGERNQRMATDLYGTLYYACRHRHRNRGAGGL